ncbi:hypothetical protein Dcar01_03224 [Deinococcus carri]|uniref:DinB-like domain-containing protein n=1 Tax=Deinococcus carri TaxID=1211323 RepID=A0ABP9WAV6_9DEIO
MNELQDFLTEQYAAELNAFRAALNAVPDEHFAAAGVGHSPAWHALHIAEWLRLAVLGDRSATYAHLGWEDQPWVQALSGTPALSEDAGKDAVLAYLDDISGQVLTFLQNMSAEELQGTSFSPSAPGGERPRLQGIGLHLRHVAYHRGQVRLGMKEQA